MDLMSTAQLLGNFGEFFGAIAVVVTLAYLATQIRHGNELARRNEMNVGHEQTSQLRMAVAIHRDVAELMALGTTEPSSLDAVDRSRYNAITMTLFRLGFQAWDRARHGLLDEREWVSFREVFAATIATDGGGAWWTNNKHGFLDEFRVEIDGVVAGRS